MLRKFLYLILALNLVAAASPASAVSLSTPMAAPNTTNTVPANNQINNSTQTKTGAIINVPKVIQSAVTNLMNKDANIRKIAIDGTKVQMDYRQNTKLFWFIPVRFNLHVVADPSKKDIKLGRPWWTIVAPTNVRKILSDLKSNINSTTLGTNLTNNQTKIIQTISNTLKKIS